MAKKTHLELQFRKFIRLNGIKWDRFNAIHFRGFEIRLRFQDDGYVYAFKPPLKGPTYQFPVTSIPELLYKLVKYRILPAHAADGLQYSPFNFTQTQLALFTEYEEKLRAIILEKRVGRRVPCVYPKSYKYRYASQLQAKLASLQLPAKEKQPFYEKSTNPYGKKRLHQH